MDGARCIGGTKMILAQDGVGVLLDFGLNYNQMGKFFEEFLKPRSNKGLADYLDMGLLPGYADLYRQDALPQSDRFQNMATTGLQVVAAIFSHPHFDHTGMAGFLRPDMEFYGTPECALTSKASQDIRPDISTEIAYLKPRLWKDGALTSPSKKAEKVAVVRRWKLFSDDLNQELLEFWDAVPYSSYQVLPAEPEFVGLETTVGPFRLKVFPVDHSAPGAAGFALETEAGWVVYTGDLRLHGFAGGKTKRFVEEASGLKPLRALIIEGTRIPKPGEEAKESPAEEEVASRLLQLGKRAEAALNAEFPYRHPERLMSFYNVAKELGRKMVLMPGEFYTIKAISSVVPELRDVLSDVLVYKEARVRPSGWEKTLLEDEKVQWITPEEISQDVSGFLTCFRYWNINRLLDIGHMRNGMHIYSTSEPHSEEQEWDLARLRNWLEYFGMEMVGGPKEHPDDPLHASGHASSQELLEIVRALEPQELIPVHTFNPEFYQEHLSCCRIRYPEEKMPL